MPLVYNKPHHQAEPDAVQDIKAQDNKEIIGWEFKPRAFNIVWGSDDRYWVIPSKEVQDGAAELVQVSWFEVTASTKDLSPGKSYEISFEVSMSQGEFGWKDCPVSIMAKVGKSGRYKRKRIRLPSPEDSGGHDKQFVPSSDDRFVVEVPSSNAGDSKLYFGLYEVWTGMWKGGLRIYKAVVKELEKQGN